MPRQRPPTSLRHPAHTPSMSPRAYKCVHKRRRYTMSPSSPSSASLLLTHGTAVRVDDITSVAEDNDSDSGIDEEEHFYQHKKRRYRREAQWDLEMEVQTLRESIETMEKQVAHTATTINELKILMAHYIQNKHRGHS